MYLLTKNLNMVFLNLFNTLNSFILEAQKQHAAYYWLCQYIPVHVIYIQPVCMVVVVEDGAGRKTALPDVEELLILWIEWEHKTYASPAVLFNGGLSSLLENKAMESF